MPIKEYTYDKKIIKTFEVSDNGIFFNTKDLCNILNIKERPKGSTLSIPCLDLAGTVIEAIRFKNIDFAEWLIENFSNKYKLETPIIIKSGLNDDWDNIDDLL